MTTTILREIGPEDVPEVKGGIYARCIVNGCAFNHPRLCNFGRVDLATRWAEDHTAETRHRVVVERIMPDEPAP